MRQQWQHLPVVLGQSHAHLRICTSEAMMVIGFGPKLQKMRQRRLELSLSRLVALIRYMSCCQLLDRSIEGIAALAGSNRRGHS